MIDPADTRFFAALLDVLGQDEAQAPCRAAVQTALASSDPQDLRAARLEFDALPGDVQVRLMQRVHARMAGDLASIWDVLPHAPGTPRPN